MKFLKKDSKYNKPLIAILILCLYFGYVHRNIKASDSYLRQRVVQLEGNQHSCSGEQIRSDSGIDYILSAGHCDELKDSDGNINVVMEDGKQLKRRVLAEDVNSDLLLIEGLPNLEGIKIADSIHRYEHVRTHTHGLGLKTYKTEGYLIEKKEVTIFLRMLVDEKDEAACGLPKNTIQSADFFGIQFKACYMTIEEVYMNASVQPGSSGGMVVNDDGELVGVVSAGNDRGFGLMIEQKDIHKFLSAY